MPVEPDNVKLTVGDGRREMHIPSREFTLALSGPSAREHAIEGHSLVMRPRTSRKLEIYLVIADDVAILAVVEGPHSCCHAEVRSDLQSCFVPPRTEIIPGGDHRADPRPILAQRAVAVRSPNRTSIAIAQRLQNERPVLETHILRADSAIVVMPIAVLSAPIALADEPFGPVQPLPVEVIEKIRHPERTCRTLRRPDRAQPSARFPPYRRPHTSCDGHRAFAIFEQAPGQLDLLSGREAGTSIQSDSDELAPLSRTEGILELRGQIAVIGRISTIRPTACCRPLEALTLWFGRTSKR